MWAEYRGSIYHPIYEHEYIHMNMWNTLKGFVQSVYELKSCILHSLIYLSSVETHQKLIYIQLKNVSLNI